MKVREVMTRQVEACPPDADLGSAALVMWRKDCGFVPVVDGPGRRVIGTVTDRDICMGLATSGRTPADRTVREVMSTAAWTVSPDVDVDDALEIMEDHRVRRLPVVDGNGALEGIVSLNDLVLSTEEPRVGDGESDSVPSDRLVRALRAICEHRTEEGKTPAKNRPRAARV